MVTTEVKLLYDFDYVIPGRDGEIASLKSGEFFILHEEKNERWLAVKKPGEEKIYYLPSLYVEQFRIVSDPNVAKRLTPPKPPYKPKNLLQRMQSDNDVEVSSPPPISEETYIELYNFVSNEDKVIKGELTENTILGDERLIDNKLKTDFEAKEVLQREISPNLDKRHKNSFNKKKKELGKKKIPVPRTGETPLKVFHGGYEMYRDDISGQLYYYNIDSCESSWVLPCAQSKAKQLSTTDLDSNFHSQKTKSTSEDVFPHKQHHGAKCGFLSRSKLTSNGGKLSKSWNHVFVVMEGTCLYFFKDQKASSNKGKSDLIIDLENCIILKGGTSSKQNLIHVIMMSGMEYLLRAETQEIAQQWYDTLSAVAKKEGFNKRDSDVNKSNVTNEEQNMNQEPVRNEILLASKHRSSSNVTLDQPVEKTTLKEKLKCWLLRRPTQESLRERGIYKDTIFGSTLTAVCKKDGTDVPAFVSNCMQVVEKEGLSVDGIYRVNGNAAEIQKLRFAVNQNSSHDFSNLDIHTVTGALKLFFRELREPLFPFEFYQPLVAAFGGQNKLQDIKYILDKFPKENYSTLKELLRHLLKVEENSGENRMKITNLAIVFGPTLLWPKESCDSDDLAHSLMTRGQLIEFLAQNFSLLFHQE